jgi:ParB family transcriptional regulator, chromosome partitioning protein
MRKALGRGIEALLSKDPSTDGRSIVGLHVEKIPIANIRPNKLQPRKSFDPARLGELSHSIKSHGLAQPVLVSFDASKGSYELIAGERRLKACQLAGLTHIDAIIKPPPGDKESFALSLIENIQREDLNPIDTALAYKKFITDFGINQGALSEFFGKSKSSISNTLRLLELSEEIQKALQLDKISEGHARAILMVSDPFQRDKLFRTVLEQKISVRDAEHLAQRIQSGKFLREKNEERVSSTQKETADVRELERNLEQRLGTRVEIRTKADQKSGKITIHFYNLSDFDKIVKKLEK